MGFNWRYDSVPCGRCCSIRHGREYTGRFVGTFSGPTDAGGAVLRQCVPTLTAPLKSCAPSQYGSTRVTIPAPGTENDDHNPPRIAPRHLFDIAVGDDNLFRGDKYKWSLRVAAINITTTSCQLSAGHTFLRPVLTRPSLVFISSAARVAFDFLATMALVVRATGESAHLSPLRQ